MNITDVDIFEAYLNTLDESQVKALLLKYVEWDKYFPKKFTILGAETITTMKWNKPERYGGKVK